MERMFDAISGVAFTDSSLATFIVPWFFSVNLMVAATFLTKPATETLKIRLYSAWLAFFQSPVEPTSEGRGNSRPRTAFDAVEEPTSPDIVIVATHALLKPTLLVRLTVMVFSAHGYGSDCCAVRSVNEAEIISIMLFELNMFALSGIVNTPNDILAFVIGFCCAYEFTRLKLKVLTTFFGMNKVTLMMILCPLSTHELLAERKLLVTAAPYTVGPAPVVCFEPERPEMVMNDTHLCVA
jgi:ABC-type glycerol-3-phosphate transport system permease component